MKTNKTNHADPYRRTGRTTRMIMNIVSCAIQEHPRDYIIVTAWSVPYVNGIAYLVSNVLNAAGVPFEEGSNIRYSGRKAIRINHIKNNKKTDIIFISHEDLKRLRSENKLEGKGHTSYYSDHYRPSQNSNPHTLSIEILFDSSTVKDLLNAE